MRFSFSAAALLLLASAFGGCSSFSSRSVHPDEPNVGLVYFLPKKDLLVTLTVASGKLTGVTISVTPAYPDRNAAYVLDHMSNGLAKNVTTFEVKNGLLTSSVGTLTSGVSEALKNLASSSAAVGGMRRSTEQPETKKKCGSDGNHTFRIASDGRGDTVCGVQVTIERLAPPAQQASPTIDAGSTRDPLLAAPSRAGIYYRQLQALLVVARGEGLDAASILYVPATPAYLLPSGRSFFANNGTEMTLEDGVPTKIKRDADGEIVALLKLPADVLAAYFAAVGSVFDAFKSRDSKEITSLQESFKLESAKQKYAVCLAAVKAGDDDLVAKLGCDKL